MQFRRKVILDVEADLGKNVAARRPVVISSALADLAGEVQRGVPALRGQISRECPQSRRLTRLPRCMHDKICLLIDEPGPPAVAVPAPGSCNASLARTDQPC